MRGIFNIISYVVGWTVLILLSAGLGLILAIPVWLLTFKGSAQRAEKAAEKLNSTLMEGEELIASGLQHRAYALAQRRVLVAVTASRIVTVRRGILGGFKMQDIQWKDLTDATIEENILPFLCGSNLNFAHSGNRLPQFDVPGVESEAARQIYRHSQAEEQAWEEKRRVRTIEETRAAAGGVTVHTAAPAPATPAPNRFIEEIAKAKALLDAGAISDAEYNEMKAKILGSI